jgi:hypothetical protein
MASETEAGEAKNHDRPAFRLAGRLIGLELTAEFEEGLGELGAGAFLFADS